MPSIGVPLAIRPRRQLTAIEGEPLEVEREDSLDVSVERGAARHDHWLREISLCKRAAAHRWVDTGNERKTVQADCTTEPRGRIRWVHGRTRGLRMRGRREWRELRRDHNDEERGPRASEHLAIFVC